MGTIYDGIFYFDIKGVYMPCKNLHFIYLGNIALVSIWSRMMYTQIITRVHKNSLTLTYPCNINILSGMTILIPRVGS